MQIRPLVESDKSAVQSLIKDAFSGFPWYLDYTQTELERLWRSAISEIGFTGLLALDQTEIVGGSWWHLPSPETVRGKILSSFIENIRGDRILVWEDAILVRQNNQRCGIGSELRRAFIAEVKKISMNGALIISRMRSDNTPSLLLAERLGFRRTGAASRESDEPALFQEFWYLVID